MASSSKGIDTLIWSDEQTRCYLQLYIDEKLKGNVRKQGLNECGRENIIEKFNEMWGVKHLWNKFQNKHNTCRKQYTEYRRLTHNKTGLGYDAMGVLQMSEDWWKERIAEWPGARKYRRKPLANMDLLEEIFGSVHISGAEGWSAQHGESSLDSRIPVEHGDASESAETEMPMENAPPAQNLTKSRATRKRRSSELVPVLKRKNELIEQMSEYACNVTRAMSVLNSLSSVSRWSPLYIAAMKHLKEDLANREAFLVFEEDEDKIKYLECMTGRTRVE